MPIQTRMQQFTPAPATVRMADGRVLPASNIRSSRPPKPQKLLIVVQYFEGDKQAAEDLGSLIADLERIRNHDADIMIFRRFDATEFSRSVRTKLEDKFDKVYFETCRRRDASKYPFASNQMWGDLVTLMAQFAPWATDYYAFIPLEADCVPVHPGWIGQLIEEYRVAVAHGKSAVGHFHRNPVDHFNGVAVYNTQLWRIVGGGRLNGSDAQVAYDIYHARDIMPIAEDTPLIMFEFQRPTITARDLFQNWKGGIEPAIFHGVKDGSAREAVRARYITFSEQHDISRSTVFTYAHHSGTQPLPSGTQAMTTLWADGWRSRGWNPVVLRLRDAVKNHRFQPVVDALKKFPYVGDPTELESLMLRWVALDSMGGGMMVDADVLPGNFTPDMLPEKAEIFGSSDRGISAGFFPQSTLQMFLGDIASHDAAPDELFNGKPHVTDASIIKHSPLTMECAINPVTTQCGDPGWQDGLIVEFKALHMMKLGVRGTTLTMMEQYLRGA